MVDILLTTWHRQEITRKVIETIHRNTRPGTYRLLVCDNGSPPEMQEMLLYMRVGGLIDELMLNKTNKGLEPARNLLLKGATSDLIVTTDSDCLPEPPIDGKDWLERLIELMDRYPKYAAISCRTQVMIGTGNIFEEADENGADVVQFGHPGGSLRIMRTGPVRKVGGWRDSQAGRGSEERYICGLLREHGWETGFATQIKCLHLFGDRRQATDRWGYPGDWLPSDTGHSDIWHPVLQNGDDPEEVKKYTGED